MHDDLVKRLRRCEQFRCRECEYEQVMGCRAKLNAEAADAIEELRGALLLMVLQYCTTDDGDGGVLYHSFMSAGENAFAVLGLENGQQADPLWDTVLNQKLPKEE